MKEDLADREKRYAMSFLFRSEANIWETHGNGIADARKEPQTTVHPDATAAIDKPGTF